ncbi:Recombination endonuclease VII [uncultured Caudovirales phage]|uniref:Recombination endonuclease VII n=1 Tax=uncultured Caudovirales phage TaxID=2100421 RepID=A0A6J5T2Q1_9CAUD|nr:Recombination endonuclease VII [uncultured Caudovirales phage]CAB4220947.1 Recombination endonuclease VII [uncultured Caudovirales phage]
MSYQELLMIKEDQDYKCAICGVHEENVTKALAVDHDHATGLVRGYLCNNCNRGIGLLKDDPKVLQNAIDYLERNYSQYGGSQGGDSTPDQEER